MHILLCLITPVLALILLTCRWKHPWQLRLPLILLRRAAIHPALLKEPRRMTAAHLPFAPAAQPRLQSGALLWASAATVTHTLAPQEDQAAILASVKPLGFTPEKFLARCPILREVEKSGQRGFSVRDGLGQRAYFIGPPAELLACCSRILDQQERDRTNADVSALPAGATHAFAMAAVENDVIGSMVYLGSMEIAAPAMTPEAVQALLPPSWTVCDCPGDALTLHIAPDPEGPNRLSSADFSWSHLLAEGYQRALGEGRTALALFIAQLMLGIAGAIWRIPAWLVPVCGLLLLPSAIERSDVHPSRRSLPALLWLLLWPALTGAFVHYTAPGSPALMLALPLCACCLGASSRRWKAWLPACAAITALLWLIFRPAPIPAAFCLIAGALHGLVARWLRPMECS